MKGLILKDMYTLAKELRLFFAFTIIVIFLQNDFLFIYLIFFAAMLPITAMGYDERSRWDKLANMLPLSARQIVMGKYLTGYCSVGIAVLCVIFGRLFGVSTGRPMPSAETWLMFLTTICGSLLIQAVNLPLMFLTGVERGRLLFIMITVVSIVGTVSLWDSFKPSWIYMGIPFMPALVIATIAISLISCQISKLIYERRKH